MVSLTRLNFKSMNDVLGSDYLTNIQTSETPFNATYMLSWENANPSNDWFSMDLCSGSYEYYYQISQFPAGQFQSAMFDLNAFVVDISPRSSLNVTVNEIIPQGGGLWTLDPIVKLNLNNLSFYSNSSITNINKFALPLNNLLLGDPDYHQIISFYPSEGLNGFLIFNVKFNKKTSIIEINSEV